jgi:hypothetical protein
MLNAHEQPRRHRKSGINFEDILNKEWSILTRAEYSELQTAFKRTDQRNGGISFYDLINILRGNCRSMQVSDCPSPKTARTKSTRISSTKR